MQTNIYSGTPGLACKASWLTQLLCVFAEGFCLLPLYSNHMHTYKGGKIKALLKYFLE